MKRKPKVGCQTIIWGPRIPDRSSLETILDITADAGFEGVEFAQTPVDSFIGAANIEELLDILSSRSLELIGLAGGTLAQRVDFCGSHREPYLYVDSWNAAEMARFAEEDFTLALHPCMFTAIQRFKDALPILEEAGERLRFIPDTAHLTIAGDDPRDVIRETIDRIVAVHLKDWTPVFGKSSHRYAKGFTELGRGEVNLDGVVALLGELEFDRWLIWELDGTPSHPETALYNCADWLRDHGFIPSRAKRLRLSSNNISAPFVPVQARQISAESEAAFINVVSCPSQNGQVVRYDNVVKAVSDLLPCDSVSLWASSEPRKYLGLLAQEPAIPHSRSQYIRLPPGAPCSDVVTQRRCRRTTLETQDAEQLCLSQAVFGQHGPRMMVSIPVLDTMNSHYVRYILNVIPKTREITISDEDFYCLGHTVALSLERQLDTKCALAAAEADHLAAIAADPADYLNRIVKLIQREVDAEGVTFFLVDGLGIALRCGSTTGLIWGGDVPDGDRYYRRKEGLEGRAWEEGRREFFGPRLIEAKGEGWRGKSRERVSDDAFCDYLIVPSRDRRGNVTGLVRCRNKKVNDVTGVIGIFSDDDSAVVDAIAHAASHNLQMFFGKRSRDSAREMFMHILQQPLFENRGRLHGIVKTTQQGTYFTEDYPSDIKSWLRLMSRVLMQPQAADEMNSPRVLDRTPVFLIRDVIAGAVRQSEDMMRTRGFSIRRVSYSKMRSIPKLLVDRNQLQQVFFNLLVNSIKYSHRDPSAFRVDMSGGIDRRQVLIVFRDWGAGIPEGMEERVFEEGFRHLPFPDVAIDGDGFGLTLVRQIISAHGGRVHISNSQYPTEFSITLPWSTVLTPIQGL